MGNNILLVRNDTLPRLRVTIYDACTGAILRNGLSWSKV